jgi:hypothetical protein
LDKTSKLGRPFLVGAPLCGSDRIEHSRYSSREISRRYGNVFFSFGVPESDIYLFSDDNILRLTTDKQFVVLFEFCQRKRKLCAQFGSWIRPNFFIANFYFVSGKKLLGVLFVTVAVEHSV